MEKERQQSREAQQEHEERAEHHMHVHDQKQKSIKTKFYILGIIIGVVVVAIVAYSVYSIAKPGQYDNFAKCLTEKGAIMYGAMDWCKYTQAQKGMFGKSFKHINYHDYQELQGIKKTPTWVINEVWYENVQPFDKLAAITGCKI